LLVQVDEPSEKEAQNSTYVCESGWWCLIQTRQWCSAEYSSV
jgi:hypothetical protein